MKYTKYKLPLWLNDFLAALSNFFCASTSRECSGCSPDVFMRATLLWSLHAWLLFFFRQAHDYWYLVYFLFSVVARRGCPCLTNQLSFKAGGKTTSSRHCTVKCLISMNCAEKGGSGGDQQDTRSGSCSIAAGMVEREAVGSSTQDEEEKGKRKRIPRICNRAHQLDVLFVLFFIIFIVLHLAPRCPAGTPQLSWHVCEFLGWVFFPQICTVFSCFQ